MTSHVSSSPYLNLCMAALFHDPGRHAMRVPRRVQFRRSRRESALSYDPSETPCERQGNRLSEFEPLSPNMLATRVIRSLQDQKPHRVPKRSCFRKSSCEPVPDQPGRLGYDHTRLIAGRWARPRISSRATLQVGIDRVYRRNEHAAGSCGTPRGGDFL